jgi:glycerol-3-phosphate dehydrogenase
MLSKPKWTTILVGGAALSAFSIFFINNKRKQRMVGKMDEEEKKRIMSWIPPSRKDLMERIMGEPQFDLLIIGGGATGAGCALDAAQRGLKTLCVDQGDFSSGTSSKSTKLVHGGVRYLESAFKSLSIPQFLLVKEALEERGIILKNAPHLCGQLPIILPVYDSITKVGYYWLGAKVYDAVSWLFSPKGSFMLDPSYYLNKYQALKAFPMLNANNLTGAVVYYDGKYPP